MKDAIEVTYMWLVKQILRNDLETFSIYMLAEFYREPETAYEKNVKEKVLEKLSNLPFFSAESFKTKEKTEGEIKALYRGIKGLPFLYQNVINNQKYELFKIPFDILIEVIVKQNAKGIEKYGMTIDACPKNQYDWEMMAHEEAVDWLVYKEKQNQ
jgi:hypothetical protein